ncbi:Reverse transcriptase [Theobroma cacao]|nr:Reverse transcriptase [Theobroma cacao]
MAYFDRELEQLDVKITFLNDVNALNEQLNGEFEMKKVGVEKKILGLEIIRDRHASRLCLSQKSCIQKILECFGMQDAKFVTIPLGIHMKISTSLSP